MRLPGKLGKLSGLGASGQASLAGTYAWAVTVAPLGWARGASTPVRTGVFIALAALAVGAVGERWWGGRTRLVSLWAFVLASGFAWSAAPTAMAAGRVDATVGVAGMLGWALFALASAAPALEASRTAARVTRDVSLVERRQLPRGAAAYVGVGAVLACVLQVQGWAVANAERALVVRLVGVVAGLAIVGAATELALGRDGSRARSARAARARVAVASAALVLVLGLSALLLAARG
jgi:hypothetical protein